MHALSCTGQRAMTWLTNMHLSKGIVSKSADFGHMNQDMDLKLADLQHHLSSTGRLLQYHTKC